jgi:hypothetical protein
MPELRGPARSRGIPRSVLFFVVAAPLLTALAIAASHHGLELLAQNVAVAGLSLSIRAPRSING